MHYYFLSDNMIAHQIYYEPIMHFILHFSFFYAKTKLQRDRAAKYSTFTNRVQICLLEYSIYIYYVYSSICERSQNIYLDNY